MVCRPAQNTFTPARTQPAWLLLLLTYSSMPHTVFFLFLQIASGGDPDGYLDFYAVHGYPIWNEPVRDMLINMFRHPKAHWNVSKPILVGEHWEQVSTASG